jgi:hypothetical protein
MKHIIATILIFFCMGCTKTKPLCEVSKLGTEILADQIAVQLDCKNPMAIKATLEQKLIDMKVCEAPHTTYSAIGDIICPRLIPAVIGTISKKIPAEWECAGGEVKDTLAKYLLDECKKAL